MLIVVLLADWLATRKPVKASVAVVAANWIVAAPSGKLPAGKLKGAFGRAVLTEPVTFRAPLALTLATFAPVLSAIANSCGAAAAAVPVSAIESASSEIAVGNEGARRRRDTLRNIVRLLRMDDQGLTRSDDRRARAVRADRAVRRGSCSVRASRYSALSTRFGSLAAACLSRSVIVKNRLFRCRSNLAPNGLPR